MSNIRIEQMRALGCCRKGIKKFLDKMNYDWKTFLSEGIPEEQLRETGDAMAIKVIEQTREINGSQ